MRRKGVDPLRWPSARRSMRCIALSLLFFSLYLAPANGSAPAGPNSEVPAKGMVTIVGICSEHCVPCRMMEPVLKKVEDEYKGKFALVCLDKDKNKDIAGKFKARVTPTLIFFDKDGKETHRHEGVMDKNEIVATLRKAGME